MSEPFLSIEPEWLQPAGVESPELAATWCRLSIAVGGEIVTRVEDLATNSTRTGIFGSAYPLAEWIATHWWALRSHVRPATIVDRFTLAAGNVGIAATNGLAAHNTRAAGDGFIWPNLLIVPEGQRTLLAWFADSAPQSGLLRFASAGHVWADPATVQSDLARFVLAVLDRLQALDLRDTPLEEEWLAITGADSAEAEFCDTAAALGLDPYNLSQAKANSIEKLDSVLGQGLVSEFAAAADPKRISEDLDWVTTGLKKISHAPAPAKGLLGRLRQLTFDDVDAGPPWETGWRHAQTIRAVLRVADTRPVDLGGIFAHHHVAATDASFQALASGISGRIEVVVGIRSGLSGQRFVESRALWRDLHVRDRPYLLTTAATFEQRIERAFAAELLAPASGIAKLLKASNGVVLAADVERVARHFKASPVVVGHQVENQLGLVVAA